MTYTVRHYHPNPRLNTSVECASRTEAIREAKTFSSEAGEHVGVSKIFQDGRCIAVRSWDRRNLTY